MKLEVKRVDGSLFHASHAREQERLILEAPEKAMKSRLRPYFPMDMGESSEILYVEHNGKVVAVAECLTGVGFVYSVCYVSVDPDFRNMGLGSSIVDAIVMRMKELGRSVLDASYYTDTGNLYLKHVLRRVVALGIELREDGTTYHATRP